MYVCMYVYMYVCMYNVCIYVCMYIITCLFVYSKLHNYGFVYVSIFISWSLGLVVAVGLLELRMMVVLRDS